MSLDFNAIFQDALGAGLGVARAGGRVAEDWLRATAEAHLASLQNIAEGVATGEITPGTAGMLLKTEQLTMEAETIALSLIIRATAQGAVNAFIGTLRQGIGAALGILI